MFKNLVKRSTYTVLTVTQSTPVTMLIEGDEVNVYARSAPGLTTPAEVKVERQTERVRNVAEAGLDPVSRSQPVRLMLDTPPVPLSGRVSQGYLDRISPTVGDVGTNLLTAFSDNVTFSIAPDDGGIAAVVVIEVINYEARR